MNEMILTSLLFFIKSCLNQSILRNCNISESCRVHFGILDSSVLPVPNLFKRAHYNFFFGCSQLVSEWLWFESFLATACPTNKYGWDCTKTCFCKNSLHCNRYTGPTDKCECKDGYFNPPFCQAGNPALLPKFPLSNLFKLFFVPKKFFFGKKKPTWHVFRAAYRRCVLDRRAALLTQQQIV